MNMRPLSTMLILVMTFVKMRGAWRAMQSYERVQNPTERQFAPAHSWMSLDRPVLDGHDIKVQRRYVDKVAMALNFLIRRGPNTPGMPRQKYVPLSVHP